MGAGMIVDRAGMTIAAIVVALSSPPLTTTPSTPRSSSASRTAPSSLLPARVAADVPRRCHLAVARKPMVLGRGDAHLFPGASHPSSVWAPMAPCSKLRRSLAVPLGQAGPLRLFQLLAKLRRGASPALGGWTSRQRLRRWRRAPPGSGKRLAGPYHQQLRLQSMMEQPRLAPRTLPLLLQMVGCSSSTTGFSPRCPRLCSPCRHLLHRAQHRLLLAAKPWQG
jgi:hypothetical protein